MTFQGYLQIIIFSSVMMRLNWSLPCVYTTKFIPRGNCPEAIFLGVIVWGAIVRGAIVQGAIVRETIIQGAIFQGAIVLEPPQIFIKTHRKTSALESLY